MKIFIIAPPERKFSAWIGGSILASLSTFKTCGSPRRSTTGPTPPSFTGSASRVIADTAGICTTKAMNRPLAAL